MKKIFFLLFFISCNEYIPSIDRAIDKKIKTKTVYTNGESIVIDNTDYMVKIKSTSSWITSEQWYYTYLQNYNNTVIGYPVDIRHFYLYDTNNENTNNRRN